MTQAAKPRGHREQGRVSKRGKRLRRYDRGRSLRRAGQDARTDAYQHNGADEADEYAGDGPCCAELPPEDRQQDGRHARTRGDREGQRHEEGHVEALGKKGQDYRAYRDSDRRVAGSLELLCFGRFAVAKNVVVKVVGEGA